jgi:hypothetical protein
VANGTHAAAGRNQSAAPAPPTSDTSGAVETRCSVPGKTLPRTSTSASESRWLYDHPTRSTRRQTRLCGPGRAVDLGSARRPRRRSPRSRVGVTSRQRCPAPRAFATRAFPIASALSARRTVSAVGSGIWGDLAVSAAARRGSRSRCRPRPRGRCGSGRCRTGAAHPDTAGRAGRPPASICSATSGRDTTSRHGSPFRPASIAYHTRTRPEAISCCRKPTLAACRHDVDDQNSGRQTTRVLRPGDALDVEGDP